MAGRIPSKKPTRVKADDFHGGNFFRSSEASPAMAIVTAVIDCSCDEKSLRALLDQIEEWLGVPVLTLITISAPRQKKKENHEKIDKGFLGTLKNQVIIP